ncbi:MAG: amidohydrolase family protein [Gemmatimonadales bacterium]|nr:amidohydrolase family protein [Gemmatimonadales bacterium]MDQ3426452.1 amidohydrolase family protein [Gemmatimonadota bacterium]
MRQVFAAAGLLAGLAPAPLLSQDTTALAPSVREYVSVAAPVVALTNVRVVDGTGAPPAPGRTIVIERGRIRAVGPAREVKVPRGARVLDLAGHTVIPGLVGLHNHTWYTTTNRATQLPYSAPRLYLGAGVTTIRTTGSLSPYVEMNMKHAVEKGELVGPRMHITGPYITGANTSMRMYNVKDSADARRVVAYWAEEGATWFKVYTRISRGELAAVVDEAHKRGLKVTGHLCSVGFREAVAIGIDNLEHGLFVNTEYDPAKQPDACPTDDEGVLRNLDLQSEPVQATFRDMIAKKIPMTSTLAVYELFVPNRPPLEERVLEAMSPDVRTEYLATRVRIAEAEGFGISPAVFKKAQQFELAFVRAGGLLAAGVDPTGNGGALPGFGDQRNFELLIESGFTPVEAVRIMSLNGAKILGVDKDLGSIAPGKIADLVVIQGDPIARPAEIRKVVTVFKDGVGYDSAKLLLAARGQVGVR